MTKSNAAVAAQAAAAFCFALNPLAARGGGALVAGGIAILPAAALAGEPAPAAWSWQSVYTVDVVGPIAGARSRGGRALDDLDLTADADLQALVGWAGGRAHAYVLNNAGAQPNALAGTLQGVDNIEVPRPRLRLYELWLEQAFAGGAGSVRAGLYDLNSEFYATESSDLFLAPAFGIGTELAATGSAGPSIFPSTAPALRVRVAGTAAYAQAAVLSAAAGVPGDPGGVRPLDAGALVVAEGGVTAPVRLALGIWRYTDRQPSAREVGPDGEPVGRTAQGVYGLLEAELWASATGERDAQGFLRVGASDGETTAFAGGWQAGVTLRRPFGSRPDSALGLGVSQARLSDGARANLRDAGVDAAQAETQMELTYSDSLSSRLSLQPDLQVVFDAGGDRAADPVWIAGLRLTLRLH